MAYFNFNNIKITGVACAVPKTKIKANDFYDRFGQDHVDKFVKMTGVEEIRKTGVHQTAADLGCAAAEELLQNKKMKREDIKALIFSTHSMDYRRPATACVLHKRLHLKRDCVAFDVNLGCSAFVYSAQIISGLMANSNIDKGLLIVSETMSKTVHPEDKSSIMLFGDAGAAILFEKVPDNKLSGILCSDGNGYKSIIIPAGGFRNLKAPEEALLFSDGNKRTLYNVWMDGAKVFEFTIRDVPKTIKSYMEYENTSPDTYDYFIMHQANKYIHKQLQKRLNISPEKMPLSLDRYGNTSAAAIPLTLCDTFGTIDSKTEYQMLMSGFGVGLSWGVMGTTIKCTDIYPIIETEECFTEGIIHTPEEWEEADV